MRVVAILLAVAGVANGLAVIAGYGAGGAGFSVVAALLACAVNEFRRASR